MLDETIIGHPARAVFNAPSFIWALVLSLLFWGCPSNIAGFVIPVVVNSIQSETGWAVSDAGNNVSKEDGEVIPTLTDFDPSSAIIFEAYGVWVSASATHGFPCPVEWMHFPVSGEPVFASYAAARFGAAFLQAFAGCNFNVSAVALTAPHGADVDFTYVDWFQSNQTTKSATCDSYGFGHRTAPTVRRSSDEAGVHALASLRILTLTMKEG